MDGTPAPLEPPAVMVTLLLQADILDGANQLPWDDLEHISTILDRMGTDQAVIGCVTADQAAWLLLCWSEIAAELMRPRPLG